MLYKSAAESSGARPGRSEEEELQAALEASMQVLHTDGLLVSSTGGCR